MSLFSRNQREWLLCIRHGSTFSSYDPWQAYGDYPSFLHYYDAFHCDCDAHRQLLLDDGPLSHGCDGYDPLFSFRSARAKEKSTTDWCSRLHYLEKIVQSFDVNFCLFHLNEFRASKMWDFHLSVVECYTSERERSLDLSDDALSCFKPKLQGLPVLRLLGVPLPYQQLCLLRTSMANLRE